MQKLLFVLASMMLAASSAVCARADVIGFRTPTGNIGCVYASLAPTAPNLRCDIRSGLHNPKLPPRPGSCSQEVDFGQGLWIASRGPAQIVCAGDTALDPSARVLRYGTSFIRGAFRCDSKFDGLTCKNQSGHGFFLNADRWQLF